MYQDLKESKITSWWIAPSLSELTFVNILSEDAVKGELLVVGYLKTERHTRKLWTSSNSVVKITDEGVITAQGTFYPFEEAHGVYLQFLIEANRENTLLAFRWEYTSKLNKRRVIANLLDANGAERKDVTFDIAPDKRAAPALVSGYSEELGCNVAFSTFNRRSFCIRIGISDEIEKEIYRSSFSTHNESKARVQQVREIFNNNVGGQCICIIN